MSAILTALLALKHEFFKIMVESLWNSYFKLNVHPEFKKLAPNEQVVVVEEMGKWMSSSVGTIKCSSDDTSLYVLADDDYDLQSYETFNRILFIDSKNVGHNHAEFVSCMIYCPGHEENRKLYEIQKKKENKNFDDSKPAEM